jgi:ABC-type transport system involved in cytochrome bd biosynthesis fused ATPase/permease subunit
MVTHDQDLAARARRIVLLADGEVVARDADLEGGALPERVGTAGGGGQ